MKRKWIALISLLLMLSCVCVSALAEDYFVADNAGLFTLDQADELNRLAAQLSEQHNVGLYIITMQDFVQDSQYRYLGDYIDSMYHRIGLGLGAEKNGIVLALSMAGRDYNVYWYGPQTEAAIREGNIDSFEQNFLPYFRNNDFYNGFRAYLNACHKYLTAAESGEPIGGAPVEEKLPVGIAAIPGAFAALIVGLLTSAPMHSARQKADANDYVAPGGLDLYRRSDMFLHRSVSRRPRQTSSSSGSGGVHHHSSGGHSHGGKF